MLKEKQSIPLALLIAIAVLPGLPGTGFAQGDAAGTLFLKGEYEECLAACEKGLAEGFSPALAIQELRTLLVLGKYAEANVRAVNFLGTYRYDPELFLAAAGVFQATGRMDNAKAVVGVLLNGLPEPPWNAGSSAVVSYAELMVIAGADGKKVLTELLEPAKEADPKMREPYLAIGRMGLKHHDLELAAENFRAGHKLFPGDAEFLLGMELSGIPLPDTEVDEENGILGYADLALKANPNFPDALLYKANQLTGRKDFKAAREMLGRLFSVNPSHPEGHGLAAAISLLEEDVKKAEASLKQARKFWQDNPAVWSIVGETLAGQYRFAEGLVYLKKAAAASPDSPEILFELGSNQLRFGELDEGWKNVGRARELDPYHVAAFNLMALHDKIATYPVLEKGDVMLRMSPEDMAVFGQRAMDLAVRAKETLAEKYRMKLSQPVMVEMLPEQEDFAIRTFGLPGGESFLGVCFGPLITMTSPRGRLGRANWEAVLWHEMAHTVTLDMSRHRIPRWLSEGISVYEERQAREGWGQGMTSAFRTRLLEDELAPVETLDKLFAGPDIMLGYYQSSLVVEFMVGRFGIESMRRILNDLASAVPLEKAFATHSLPLSELNSEFTKFARTQAEAYGPGLDWTPLTDTEYKEYRDHPGKWVSANPGRYASTMMLASKFLEEGKWAEAKTLAERMVKAAPDNREDFSPYQILADSCKGLGDPAGERTALLKLYTLDANRSEAAARLLKMEASDSTDADRMLETNPFQDQAYRSLAKENASRKDYESLLSLEPRDASRLHYELAVILRETDPRAARRHVLQALEDNPRFKLALDLLVTLKKSP